MNAAAPVRTDSADGRVDFGRPTLVLRRRRLSTRVSRRAVVVCTVLAVTTFLLALVSLGVGTLALSPMEVLAALADTGGNEQARLAVVGWRLPRLLLAVLCGAALAVSGAIFQSLTKNPLGSPDIIGFSTGSYTGAIVVMLWLGSTTYLNIAAGSLVGGCVVAFVVYVLAYRRGIQAFRLIIVGIGISAILGSINSMLLIAVSPEQAMLAAVWGAGSLNGLGYAQLWPVAISGTLLILGAALIVAPLRQLEIGDDAARALGIRAQRSRALATVLGVALTAVVTAAVGPISFVALAAPQIARRLTRGIGLELLPAALTGALVLVAADLIAQRVDLPVGVITVSVGGSYLAWLLISEYRTRGRL
ncbi:iron chelate uptake ABC transporter family permease subunit [Occultella aeris]|uniref:Ferric enterobactin transport system permease protein FepG n=1 Tax=Occultella aeris TaxID=2761496 RepID=A0A7M4DQC6_9MICO|nr:iron chelate uptake ABC transporter family permease subunit [Occultella aeris]VZO39670.1 Ferric enterobactin transport system permease protein FepG [Occultella aeris]